MSKSARKLSVPEREILFRSLENRFEKNKNRHKGIAWKDVEARLISKPDKCWSLFQMEETGGEPDVVMQDKKSGAFIFYDCSAESPAGRRSLCYDREALDKRKENKPKNSVMDLAASMGIDLLTEDQYRWLQSLGEFDLKTSSWVNTPADIRKRGGALSCDRRYGHVFLGHNGAESYFASRGFRGCLNV